MASRSVQRHLQLVIVAYVIIFAAIIYVWRNSTSQEVSESKRSSLSEHIVIHKDLVPSANHPHQAPLEVKKQADLPEKPPRIPDASKLKAQLVIRAETLNKPSVNESAASAGGGTGGGEGGGGRGGGRKDRTLSSRVVSVFDSILDCPQKLPLTFLGLNGTTDLSQDPACTWIKASVRNVEQNFVALGEEMAVLKDVTLDPKKFTGTKGGEEIASVFRQKEDSEYFKVQKGFFSLPCSSPPKGVKFHVDKRNYRRSNHLNKWFDALTCRNAAEGAKMKSENGTKNGSEALGPSLEGVFHGHVPGVTLALQRYEYANVYHTMLDWYNAFISVLILGIDPSTATFLIVDGHPWGKLDSTWANMFGGKGVLRAGHLPQATTFEYMVWVPNGYHCPLFNTDRQQVPFLPHLREYFFTSYGVSPNPGPQCKRLRMLLIRRRDYLAHPRNPQGVLARKMDNENEVRDALAAAFPEHQVRAEQLDLLSMRQQLEILSQTDILVGMHGAALTYTILLPQGAALVEMYPKYAGKTSMLFKQISQWRGIHYVRWMNQDPKNEKPNKFTYIPTNIVVDMVQQMKAKMCGEGG